MRHERNVEGLRQNAQKKKQEAIERTNQGIQKLLKEGRPVNFKTVSEASGVSTAWLYREPEIKERIEQLRSQSTQKKVPAPKYRASDASKDAMIKTLKERIRRLQAEIRGLRDHIEVVSSQMLLISDLEEQIKILKYENTKLRNRFTCESDSKPADESRVVISLTTGRSDSYLNSPDSIQEELRALSVEINSTVEKMMRDVPEEAIWKAIEALREQKAIRIVDNPTGYFVEAIRGFWKPNDGYEKSREKELFNAWFPIAQSKKLVSASRRIDGELYVYTSTDDWIPFKEMLSIHPLKELL